MTAKVNLKVQIPKEFKEPMIKRFPVKSKVPVTNHIKVNCPLCAKHYRAGDYVGCGECPFDNFRTEHAVGCSQWIRKVSGDRSFAHNIFDIGDGAVWIKNIHKYVIFRRAADKLIEWV